MPWPGWRKTLREEWARETGVAAAPSRPRHTRAEFRRLLAALPSADPRFRLAFAIGAPRRLGQVIRATRRAVSLAPTPDAPFGAIALPGRGERKKGGTIFLTGAERDAVDAALAGALRAYEAVFLTDQIRDYPLFPSGVPDAVGVLPVEARPRAMDRTTVLTLFHALERAAGVPSVPGRGWYGVRRLWTDLTAGETEDRLVRESVGGHSVDVQDAVYRDAQSPVVLRKAAAVRGRVMLTLAAGDAAIASSDRGGEPPCPA